MEYKVNPKGNLKFETILTEKGNFVPFRNQKGEKSHPTDPRCPICFLPLKTCWTDVNGPKYEKDIAYLKK